MTSFIAFAGTVGRIMLALDKADAATESALTDLMRESLSFIRGDGPSLHEIADDKERGRGIRKLWKDVRTQIIADAPQVAQDEYNDYTKEERNAMRAAGTLEHASTHRLVGQIAMTFKRTSQVAGVINAMATVPEFAASVAEFDAGNLTATNLYERSVVARKGESQESGDSENGTDSEQPETAEKYLSAILPLLNGAQKNLSDGELAKVVAGVSTVLVNIVQS